jgi:hypothetical protein
VKLNQKMNIRTYLFVLKSSYERISRKKKEVPKFVSRLFSYSHLASKFSFGEHPYQTLGRPKHPWALFGSHFPKALLQQLNGFWASSRSRHVLTYRLKQTMRQKTPSNKINLLLQYSNQLWAENTFFSPRLKIFCFPTKTLLGKQNNF